MPITVRAAGTAAGPITILAESVGKATISGSGQFVLKSPAAYVVIQGFTFTGSGTLVTNVGTQHVKVLRNTFRSGSTTGQYLHMFGNDPEVAYNVFRDKVKGGPAITLDQNTSS